ncbi:recombinase family protein [Methylobacterium oryzae]|uniref:Recombinase domain-containing protein n=1 Tax=Methylobacterium oryzae TaxID=334852 RepID=A0ABU7TKZ4_9HYPH
MTTFPLNQFPAQARGDLGVLIVEDIDRSAVDTVRPSTPKKPAVIYARGADAVSVERQVTACQDYVASKGMTLLAALIDQPATGSAVAGRPALARLMEAAARREFGTLVVADLDRLCRDLTHLEDLFARLSALGVEVHQPGRGRLGITDFVVRGFMAEEERRMMRERTRHGLRDSAREGRIPGRTCYGYRTVAGRPGRPSVIRRQADVVREAFRMRAEGMGCANIAAALNRANPTLRQWKGGGIARMLRNPLYDGILVHGRTAVVSHPGTGMRVPAPTRPETWVVTQVERLRIVDHETWLTVQASFHDAGGPVGRR